MFQARLLHFKKKKKFYLVCYIIILNFDDYPKRSKVYTFTLLSSLCIFIIQSFILVNYINFVSCIHIYVGMSLLLTINNSIYIYIYFSQKQKQKQKIVYITSENKIKNKIKL